MPSWSRWVALCLAVGLGSTQALATGHGVIPWRGGVQNAASPICANPHVTYFGGPLLQSPTVYPVFWTSGVSSQT